MALESISFPQPVPTTVTTAKKFLIPTTVTTEAMVQAELYMQLKAAGIKPILEFRAPGSRFDCIVVDAEGYLAAIIECKNYKRNDKEFNTETKQYQKYSEFGAPVIGCPNMAAIPGVVLQIRNLLGDSEFNVDALYEKLPDLVNDSFKAWYCAAFWKLGGAKVTDVAEQARKGKNPRRLFSWLLKQELGQ